MGLKKILVEIATPIINHFTGIGNLAKILDANTFNTSNVLGTHTDERHQRGKFYFLSFQRSGHGNIGYARFKRGARIEIDGTKLNQNHKVIPVDYWNAPRDPVSNPSNRDQMLRNNEMEDRLVTNLSEIPNASKFIRRIDVLIKDGKIEDREKNSLITINRQAEQLGIDIFYYTDGKEWNNQTDNHVKFESLGVEPVDEEEREPRITIDYTVVTLIKLIDNDIYNEVFDYYLNDDTYQMLFDKYYSKDKTKYKSLEDYILTGVEDAEDSFKRNHSYITDYDDWRLREKTTVIKNFFHNYRSEKRESAKFLIQKFVQMMNKHNLKNIKDVIIQAIENINNE